MTKRMILGGLVLLAGTGFHAQAQESNNAERTPHAAMFLTAPLKAGTTVSYAFDGAGKEYQVYWGMDTAWDNEGNVRCGTNHIGKENMRYGRISFQPNDLVGEDLQLSSRQKTALRNRVTHIKLSGTTEVQMNCDHEMLVADHYKTDGVWKTGGEEDWKAACANYKGEDMHQRWYRLIKASVKYAETLGVKVVSVAPFNEPDYTAWNEGTKGDFYEIARLISEDPEMAGIRISAGNTLNCDRAMEWYNAVKPYVTEGNTHQLAGSFDNYANFFKKVREDGNYATGDELHNVMEAMVGIEYGMQGGIWWGFDGVARGEFCKANMPGGARLGYGENRTAWNAASVYRLPDGRVKAFLGTSERQATTSTYEFVSTDRDVYYDGYGPVRTYQMEMPGGTGYQKGQTNAERVIHITSGEDVPPFQITDGDYIIMNKKSRFVVTITSGSTQNGAGISQGTYTNASSKDYQHWKIEAVDPRVGGDFSYYYIRSSRDNEKLIDVLNWSSTTGGTLCAYSGGGGTNEQWYFEYAGDGDYYIRSRYSGLCMEVKNGLTTNAATLQQGALTGAAHQRWRLIPVDAERDLTAPAVPTGLQAKGQSGSVLLTWTAVEDADCDGYMILRGEEQTDGTVAWSVIGRKVQGTKFIDNLCEAGKAYQYKVKAIDRCSNMSEACEPVAAQTDAAPALVAKYQFDKTFTDESPNQMDGAFAGNVSFQSGLKQSGTHSIVFNGTNNYLIVPPAVGTSRQMTIAAWVRWAGGSSWQRIFDFGQDTDHYMFLTPSNGSEMRFVLKNGGDEQILSAGKKLTSARWIHVAVTMDDNAVRLYIDGEETASSTSITLRPSDIHPARCFIGRSMFDADPYYKGYLDDFRVYNYALSPEEIAQVMADLTDSVEDVTTDSASPVISTEYFGVDGTRLSAPARGITIVRQRHQNGSTTTKKLLK